MIDSLKNYFYGQATHYNHPGWYFDIVIDNLQDLTSQMQIRPGRFVLVKNYGAIFMRTGSNNIFIKPFIDDGEGTNRRYFYQDQYNLSGEEVDFTQTDLEFDSEKFETWFQDKFPNMTPRQKRDLLRQLYITTGYKFISYTNPNIQIWKGGSGNLVIDFRSTDFTITDEMDQDILDIFEINED